MSRTVRSIVILDSVALLVIIWVLSDLALVMPPYRQPCFWALCWPPFVGHNYFRAGPILILDFILELAAIAMTAWWGMRFVLRRIKSHRQGDAGAATA